MLSVNFVEMKFVCQISYPLRMVRVSKGWLRPQMQKRPAENIFVRLKSNLFLKCFWVFHWLGVFWINSVALVGYPNLAFLGIKINIFYVETLFGVNMRSLLKNKRGKFLSSIWIWTVAPWNQKPVCYWWTMLTPFLSFFCLSFFLSLFSAIVCQCFLHYHWSIF